MAAPRPGRGRRPTRLVQGQILDAADRLLRHEGMAAFTVERVAALAGVSKMTIYKWWPTKGVLALEAYAASVVEVFAMPDTGDIEADLRAQLNMFVRALRDTPAGRITAELVGVAQTDPELADAFRNIYLEPRRAIGTAALVTAGERGQLRAEVDLETVSDQLWGACMYRLLMRHQPLSEEFVESLLDNVLHGIAASSNTRRPVRAKVNTLGK